MACVSAAHAQATPPPVVSPLRLEPERNGVNVDDGRIVMETPALAVPGAPHLRFERVQDVAPYVSGTIAQTPAGQVTSRAYSVHTGGAVSESFQCADFDCSNASGTGSTFRPLSNVYHQAESGAVYNFNVMHVNGPTALLYYASSVSYPDGEAIAYSYAAGHLAGDPFNRTYYRPVTVTSNRGYQIALTYQSNGDAGDAGWGVVAQATLSASADPATPLARLTYSGATITDLAGRVFQCTGCNNALGSPIETVAGSTQLPGEATPTLQVAPVAGAQIVGAVVRDGVPWTYAYANLRYDGQALGYLYDSLTVTGPNGYHMVYNMTVSQHRNVVASVTDSISRTTAYQFDERFRPIRVTYPEGNWVSVLYDDFGNVVARTTHAKPGSKSRRRDRDRVLPDRGLRPDAEQRLLLPPPLGARRARATNRFHLQCRRPGHRAERSRRRRRRQAQDLYQLHDDRRAEPAERGPDLRRHHDLRHQPRAPHRI